ncbi:hypothetical protein [Kitasatospora sp. NPDC092286]|uniref:hypothetical protein n=1 Tax=Kitasatospora sp. NPDC092286 TaxID=3364087 RepID=UPI003810C729
MSLHRENVAWQCQDGTWSIGFYVFEPDGDEGAEDFDREWGVHYNSNAFWFLSVGHPDPDAALDAYLKEEPNPGGGLILRWELENHREIARLDAIAAAYPARLAAEAAVEEARWAAIFAGWNR